MNTMPRTAYSFYIDFLESFSTARAQMPPHRLQEDLRAQLRPRRGHAGLGRNQRSRLPEEGQGLSESRFAKGQPAVSGVHGAAAHPDPGLLSSKTLKSGWPRSPKFSSMPSCHRSQDEQSVSGVVYTRNPFSGQKRCFMECIRPASRAVPRTRSSPRTAARSANPE